MDIIKEKKFDLILMDLQMPGMNGDEVTRLIRLGEDNKDTLIIACTADNADEVSARCLKAGMDDFMTKPFDITELKEKIRSMLPS